MQGFLVFFVGFKIVLYKHRGRHVVLVWSLVTSQRKNCAFFFTIKNRNDDVSELLELIEIVRIA